MRDPNFDKAREMFMAYGGDWFGMLHEGELKLYESFKVPKALEDKWRLEYRENMWAELVGDLTKTHFVSRICDTIQQRQDFDALLPLAAFAERSMDQLDTLSKILISKNLLETISPYSREKGFAYNLLVAIDKTLFRKSPAPRTRQEVRRVIRKLLESAIHSPVWVSDHHRASLSVPDSVRSAHPELFDFFSPQVLLARANEAMRELDYVDKPTSWSTKYQESIGDRVGSKMLIGICTGIVCALIAALILYLYLPK